MNDKQDSLEVELHLLPVFNAGMQQDHLSVLRRFSLRNNTADVIKNIQITFGAGFLSEPVVHTIEVLAPRERQWVEELNLQPDTAWLVSLSETVTMEVKLKIESEGILLFTQTSPVTFLGYEKWSGSEVLPEQIASFIQPTHPLLSPVLSRASEWMAEWTKDGALNEYQSRDVNRVKYQMAAIWQALKEEQIRLLPSGKDFRQTTQIRLAETILTAKQAYPLDLALLYASCLEAVGLHALVVFSEGTLLVGSWLIDEIFPDPVVDDVAALTKRTAQGIDEILLLDVTCLDAEDLTLFDAAAVKASLQLQVEDAFQYVVDVTRTRLAGVNPLLRRLQTETGWEVIPEEFHLAVEGRVPHELKPVDFFAMEERQLTKQVVWERKLLDLSLRNSLLNLRVTRSTLQLISLDLACLEDALADGKEFSVLPVFDQWEPFEQSRELKHIPPPDEQTTRYLTTELAGHRLRSYLPDADLKKSLLYLYRSSRLSMEENGANTLYLALGFLKWYETAASIKPRYAPILLLPVEIIRKSSAGGFVIRSREEETMLNITLLEMLRQNFGIVIPGLDPLPTDDSGVNVKLIYSIIRNSIKNQEKWDVDEQAVLGIFSFNKFIMWNDIHNNAHKLVDNPVVYSLMNGMIEWDAEEVTADASVLDRELSPADILLPISADSSQLEAIHEAVTGKSFILHGPPGTGKSQTITNIIANALYQGKRVLFVAEKMAALSVVQSRLAALGLDPFCLELHSNKTKKSMVMEQLRKTTEVVRYKTPEQFAAEAERLHSLRSELNKYIDALHTSYPFGLSLYEAITRYLALKQPVEIPFPQVLLDDLTPERYREWEEAIQEVVEVANTFGHPHGHPLNGLYITSYSSALKEEASRCLEELIHTFTQLQTAQQAFNSLIGEPPVAADKKQLDSMAGMLRVLLQIPELTSTLLTAPSLPDLLEEYREVVNHGIERDALWKEIKIHFTNEVKNIPARSWLEEWKRCSDKWFLPRWSGQRRLAKDLSRYSLTQKVDKNRVPEWLDIIQRFQEEDHYLEKYKYDLASYFGKAGRNGREDWETIRRIIEGAGEINDFILQYASDLPHAIRLRENLGKQVHLGIHSFRSMYGESLRGLSALLDNFVTENSRLTELLQVDQQLLYGAPEDWMGKALERLKGWQTHIDRLKDWYQWIRVYERLKELQIGFVGEAYAAENLPTADLVPVFRKGYWKAAILYIFARQPELELFNGGLFETVIRRYRDLAMQFEKLTRRELAAKLAASIPSFTREASQSSEVGILQKNIRNNARGMSIRKLFDQIPTLMERLCPCMLMSPISVAQYIDPDAEPFDLVIFDEASQVPTYEAIGAIARGKHMVIVGDPKQMPPTSFFTANTVDEEYMEMEDLESILDDCLALSIPSKYLLWHYRSKHESLIAFSNSEYYDNSLYTFPSPDNLETKVRLVPVTGYYDKGKSRQNKSEAIAVVNEIIRRLSDEELRKKSIGVVTFSSVQQTLIEDLLSDQLSASPELERLAYEAEEPVFVKNLENVQGDERDVILFSIGYGPDKNGKISMNFGPLNRNGGERRLNVAVSRARYEMMLFSTLRSDMIDLNRTSAVGVAGLKRFLEYAEKGSRIPILSSTEGSEVVSVADLIAGELNRMGYKVHTHIGTSGYRIDAGIVYDEDPSRYVLGILCDGENYKNTKTARDREIVQNSVLSHLGWTIFRVWTLDWYENQHAVLGAIIEAIDQAKANMKTIVPEPVQVKIEPIAAAVPQEEEEWIVAEEEKEEKNPYIVTKLKNKGEKIEELYLPTNRDKVLTQIRSVIETEAPIARTLVYKRIAQAWDASRQTQKVENYLEELINEGSFYQTKQEGLIFLWKDEEQCRTYTDFRPVSDREAADLPPEEVANGVRSILTEQVSMPMPDLIRLTGQLFGFARSGTNIDAAMFRGLQEAARRDYVKFSGGKIVIK